jgi:hypothetical protein
MTTAYTSLLGLALPVTGELSGTWGDTVNNSITSLLDSAIAGTTTLSSDADVTLTTTTGASNTSRQAILLWTAGGTVTRNITAPAQSKIYMVINKSSSTQSIVLRGAGPTTGVTIVQGESAVCAWNGSDFVKVSNSGGSFTTQDLTVTGNTILGDAITDTTTLNAQTRFLSLATLGYSNMTGPAATSLSTTAPAFLYSGATTYTVADVSGGTKAHAPIISLGQATIANATTATTFTNASTLYIAGAPSAGTNITLTNPFALYVAAGTSYLAGNVGVGVAPSAWRSIDKVLQVNRVSLYDENGNAMNLGHNFFENSSGQYIYLNNDFASSYVQRDSQHQWLTAPSGTAGNAFTFTQAMTLDASGNLGIGTTSPPVTLSVAGTIGVFGGSLNGSLGSPQLYRPVSDTLAIATGAVERMRIDSSGNVGIGTSSITANLQIQRSSPSFWMVETTSGTAQRVEHTVSSVGVYNQNLNWNAGSASRAFTWSQGGTENMRIDSSGNLGVGTTSPAGSANRVVDVYGSGSSAINFHNATSGITATDGGVVGQYGNDLVVFNYETGIIQFGTSNTEAARIDSSGNLLVGTTNSGGSYSKFTKPTGSSQGGGILDIGTAGVSSSGYFQVVSGNAGNASACSLFLGNNTANSRSINAGGTINASGADYAEYMTKAGDFTIAKGDVVGIDSNGKLTNVFASAVSFMVKSTDPSYVGGDSWGNEESLGLKKPIEPSRNQSTEETEAETDEDFAARQTQYEADKIAFYAALEAARQLVDRIAFAGQVPVNVMGATAGQYIIPVNDNGAIKGEAVSNPTFEQYQVAVGKVIAIESDGRAKIIVKVA